MARVSLRETLTSGVGRRILLTFLLATTMPLLLTAYLSYYEVHRGLQMELAKTLKEAAKSYGVALVERLNKSTEKAKALVRVIGENGGEISAHSYLLQDFDSAWRQRGGKVVAVIMGGAHRPVPVNLLNRHHLRSGKPQLVIRHSANTEVWLIALPASLDQVSYVYFFELNTEYLWGPEDNLPHLTQFCAFTGAATASFCTDSLVVDRATVSGLIADPVRRLPVTLPGGEEPYVIGAWQLFLDGLFAAPPINIVAGQPEQYALRSSADFRRVFPPVFGLVVVLVGTLSLYLIGKSLIPLKRLKAHTRKIADGELGSRTRITTGDEFQELGDAFNNMADQLGIQFDTMKAMSEIDRLILAGTDIDEVAEKLIISLVKLIHCELASVITVDPDSAKCGKQITYRSGTFSHERATLPHGFADKRYKSGLVQLDKADRSAAPYKKLFDIGGYSYLFVLPVVLDDEVRGLILFGADASLKVRANESQHCIDLAGRLAVALSSSERDEALYRQAHFDGLTGLPNRQLLKDRLQQQIAHSSRESRSGALLFLDLDRFKDINDVHGHSVGDLVLCQAAERIMAELRDSDTVARIGGDEFVIVLASISDESAVSSLAERLLQGLSEAFTVREHQHFLSASIGIALFPDDGNSVEMLLKNADAAMYRAKDAGRSRFEFYSEKLNTDSRRKIELERDLRQALKRGELELYYQPQFELSSGAICGAEALLRWHHWERGFVSPEEFVPLAEDTGLIIDIGRWVISEACRTLRNMLDGGRNPVPMSVNVSGLQVKYSHFVEDVLRPLQEFDIRPTFLELEITETAVAQNRDTAVQILTTLRHRGVRIAIDDFGTGYSSLSYLQQLPFDLIKIDRSFVQPIGSGDNTEKICKTIIKMAHEMGKPVIAEGVETAAQVKFLIDNECDSVQGYFYSRPLPTSEFLRFVQKRDGHTPRGKAAELVK